MKVDLGAMKGIAFGFFCFFGLAQFTWAAQPPVYETRYFTLKDALLKVFPKSKSIRSKQVFLKDDLRRSVSAQLGWDVPTQNVEMYELVSDASSIEYAVVLHELGKYYPITFMTAVTSDFKVKDVVVMVYREKIGSGVRKRRFLKQFIHKTRYHPLVVDQDVDGISGATVSSWAISSGIKKALVVAEIVAKSPL